MPPDRATEGRGRRRREALNANPSESNIDSRALVDYRKLKHTRYKFHLKQMNWRPRNGHNSVRIVARSRMQKRKLRFAMIIEIKYRIVESQDKNESQTYTR